MKTRIKALICIIATALILTGCVPATYVRTGAGYSPSYGYSYGDGQPSGYYYNPNTQTFQYQQSATVVTNQQALSFNDFYAHLSPHGIWVNIAPYGQVWVANVRNFQPYSTNGYWSYTTYGWTWVSNYSWGWAPFHYGRWGYDSRYGWYWVPGYEWGPAWVAWSSGGDMYGWAPLMPGMHYGVTLTVNLFPSSYWTFMPCRHMGSTNIGGYYVNRSRNTTIINNITIINNYGTENNRRYGMGPSAADVQRHTGRNFQPIPVTNVSDSRNTGVSNNELRVYRPGTTADNTRPTTTDNTRPTVTDNTRPTTTDNTRPTVTDNTRPTTTDNTRPTVTDNTRPTTTDNTRPTVTDNTRPTTSPTVVQPNQPATQDNEYRANPAQPRVRNTAAPQTTRQIQNAQTDNNKQQQQTQQTQRQQPAQQQQSTQTQRQQPTQQQQSTQQSQERSSSSGTRR